jgi:hypothetical protein
LSGIFQLVVAEQLGYRTGSSSRSPDTTLDSRIAPIAVKAQAAHSNDVDCATSERFGQRWVAILLVSLQNDQRQAVNSATVSSKVFGYVNGSLPGGFLSGGTGFTDLQNAAIAAAQKYRHQLEWLP